MSNAGVTNGEIRVPRLDVVTERALSPLEIIVMTLDVAPEGVQPTRMRPTISIGGRPKRVPIPRPTRGIQTEITMIPKMTSRGLVNTSLKSPGVIESPMLSMTQPMRYGIQSPCMKGAGIRKATTAERIIQSVR